MPHCKIAVRHSFLSVKLRLSFVIGVLAVELLLLWQEVEADGTAGVHVVLRVEVVLEHFEHTVLLFADVTLEPGREHLADAVVVAYRCAGTLDSVENGGVVCLECFLILHLGQEDEIQVRALRIAVRHMGRYDRVGQCMADLANIKMHLLHVRPVDGALESIGSDTEVHERIAQVRVIEAALFPALCDVAGQGQTAVLAGNFGDVFRNVFGVALLAVGKA